MNETTAKALLVDYLEGFVWWRRHQAEEHPEDGRNRRSAEGLEDLVRYVRGLPDRDERLRVIASVCVSGGVFAFPPEGAADYAVGRFRFHKADESCDAFLTWMAQAVLTDSSEAAQLTKRRPWSGERPSAGEDG